VYAFVEGPLWPEPGASSEGLSGFFRAGYADEDVNPFSHYVGAGLVYTGALPGRPEDQLGLAIAVARFGESWRGAQRALGARWARSEINVELTYRFALTDWLALQPNAQYVVNPSGDPALRDALAIGLRFALSAARSW
jgi:porin